VTAVIEAAAETAIKTEEDLVTETTNEVAKVEISLLIPEVILVKDADRPADKDVLTRERLDKEDRIPEEDRILSDVPAVTAVKMTVTVATTVLAATATETASTSSSTTVSSMFRA
jgi:hypothetical protein